MNRLLIAISVSLLFVSNLVFAGPPATPAPAKKPAESRTAEQIAGDLSSAGSSIAALDQSINGPTGLEAAAKKAEADLKKAQEAMAKANEKVDKEDGWFETNQVSSATRQAQTDATKSLEAAQAAAKKASEALEAAQKERARLMKSVKSDTLAQEDVNRAVAKILEIDGLTQEFAVLQGRVGSVDNTLNTLEAQADKSVLGAYLQDKMAMLLNSNVFCDAAQNRCEGGKNKGTLPHSKVQEELFPTAKNATRQGEYREKLKKIRDAGVAKPAAPAAAPATGGSSN